MADRTIKIIVDGDASGATRALNETDQTVDDLKKRIGDLEKKLQDSEKAVGSFSGGFSKFVADAAHSIQVLQSVGSLIGQIVEGFVKFLNLNQEWANTVDNIQDLTGATAEYASEIAYIAEIAGTSKEAVAQAFAAQARIVKDAVEQINKANADAEAKRQEARDREAQLEEEHGARLLDIKDATARKQEDLDKRVARQQEDYDKDRIKREQDVNRNIEDERKQSTDRLAEVEIAHGEKLADIGQSILQENADFNYARENAKRDLLESLEQKETEHGRNLASIQADITRANQDFAQTREDIQRDTLTKLEQAEQDHKQRLSDLDQSLERARADIAQREEDRQYDFAQRLVAITERADQQLENIAQRRADRLEQLNQSITDTQESYDDARADRAEKLADKLQEFDQRTADGRKTQQQRLNEATNEFDRIAIQSELDLYDQRRADEKAALEKAAAEQEAKEQEKNDKRIAKLQAQIDRENALYIEQQAKIKAEQEKAEADERERLARAEQRAQEDNAQRLADLQQRIDRENASYTEQTAAIQAQGDQRLADATQRNAEQLAALQQRIAEENTKYTEQTAQINREYSEREADAVRTHGLQLDAFQQRIARENEAYLKQTADITTASQQRIAQLRTDYETQAADAKAAYDREVSDNAEAQQRITDDYNARLAKENEAFVKAQEAVANSLNKFLADQQQNLPKIVGAFKELGINWDEFIKMKPDQQIATIVDGFSKMKDGANKTALEMQVFGKSGKELNDFFEVYATQTLPQWRDETEKVGKLMSEDLVQAGITAGREQNKLIAQIEGQAMKLSRDLNPSWLNFLEGLNKFVATNGPGAVKFIEEHLLPGVKTVFDKVTEFISPGGGAEKLATFFSVDVPKAFGEAKKEFDAIKLKVDDFAKNLQTKVDEFMAKLKELEKDPLVQAYLKNGAKGVASEVNHQAIQGVEDLNTFLAVWFEKKARELGLTNIFGGTVSASSPAAPYVASVGGSVAPPAQAGGTPIGGGTNINVTVQNPIAANSDIPSLVQYIQMMLGGSN